MSLNDESMIRTAVVSLFATCTLKCGYCALEETGRVLGGRQPWHYKDEEFPERSARLFNSRTTDGEKWQWQVFAIHGEASLAPIGRMENR